MIETQEWKLLKQSGPRSIEEVLSGLMENRGVDPVAFFRSELKDLEFYLDILNLDRASERAAIHLVQGDKVVLVGDYDCDGVTATAQMSLFLRDLGYDQFDVVIPRREEGYGIPMRAIEEHVDAKLFIAMDCGTLDRKPVQAARDLGAEVIVLDHHEAPSHKLAPATVLVNPKQLDCPSPFKDFCTSGLVLLFLTRLRNRLDGDFARPKLDGRYLALAALGTVADIVPLVEANRIIVQAGLRAINRRVSPSIACLQDVAGLTGREVKASHVSFQLAPLINAAGREADPMLAFDLLVASEHRYALLLAQELGKLNENRRLNERKALAAIRERFDAQGDGDDSRRTVVMGDEAWSPGLIGILASRIQRQVRYGPAVVLSYDSQQQMAKGSARSVPGFDLQEALEACDDLLDKWGGHKMAAGLTLSLDRVDDFSRRFEEFAAQKDSALFIPRGSIDMRLDLELVSEALVEALEDLEPHGADNPAPLFMASGCKVIVQRVFGRDGRHLSLLVDGKVPGVFWNGAGHARELLDGRGNGVDVVFNLDWDGYYQRPRIRVKSLIPAGGRHSPGAQDATG